MSLSSDIISEVIVDGVKITTYKNGHLHFESIEQQKQIVKNDDRSWWEKLKDWWNNSPVTPYAKIRDLADPFGDREDPDAGCDGKSAVEIGLKIKF